MKKLTQNPYEIIQNKDKKSENVSEIKYIVMTPPGLPHEIAKFSSVSRLPTDPTPWQTLKNVQQIGFAD